MKTANLDDNVTIYRGRITARVIREFNNWLASIPETRNYAFFPNNNSSLTKSSYITPETIVSCFQKQDNVQIYANKNSKEARSLSDLITRAYIDDFLETI